MSINVQLLIPKKSLNLYEKHASVSPPLIFPKPKMTQIKNATFSSARRASALGSSWSFDIFGFQRFNQSSLDWDLLELLNKSEISEISIQSSWSSIQKMRIPNSLTVWSQILRLASKMTPYSLVTGIMGIVGCCSQEISSIPTNLPLFPT